jgi:cytochrome c biogenesis protein CcdA
MASVFALSVASAANPTLLAVVGLMLTRAEPRAMLSSYLAGALAVSLTCGFLLVFVLAGTGTASTTKHTVSPVTDITIGAVILLVVAWVGSGRGDRRLRAMRERRRQKAEDKPMPRWRRTLQNASPWKAFLLGIVLTLPGAEYVAGMDVLSRQRAAIAIVVLVVLAFNVIQLVIIEVPTIGFVLTPHTAAAAVERFSDWGRRRGERAAGIAGVAIGAVLILRGVANL